MFKAVDGEGFVKALEAAPASPALREQYSRYDGLSDSMDTGAAVHVGPISHSGTLRVPALCTLIVGDLAADVIDLQTEYDEEPGLFVVIGNVTCHHMISHYAMQTFIDGDLTASGSIVNAFSDSSMSVIGTLRTKLFIGADIWAEVGGGALIDYGVGYCMPLGGAGADIIRPRHSEQDTAKIVAPRPRAKGYAYAADQFAVLIRAGKPIFA